jgi:AcrR family transcriptional regulator
LTKYAPAVKIRHVAMPTEAKPSRPEQRNQMLEVASAMLEEAGPEALQARRLTAAVGASTQAVYTLFGGMPGLFEALVADGFERFAEYVEAVPETDDPVADFFAQGRAYCQWALEHPQHYRLMFGLTGGGLRRHAGLEMNVARTFTGPPEGRAAFQIMIGAMDRIQAAGRIRPVDSLVAAGQFLSATHGYVLLAIGGVFELDEEGLEVITAFAVNLMVGLGDGREAVEGSIAAALGTQG